jgi:uncharacterized protein YcbK (DUF882 family)
MNSLYFKPDEFACKCGCGMCEVNDDLVTILHSIREHFDRPVIVTSGNRCKAHNRAVGGSKGSYHVKAMAADIVVQDVPADVVQELCEDMDVPGLGRYKDFTHVDVRDGRSRWYG